MGILTSILSPLAGVQGIVFLLRKKKKNFPLLGFRWKITHAKLRILKDELKEVIDKTYDSIGG